LPEEQPRLGARAGARDLLRQLPAGRPSGTSTHANARRGFFWTYWTFEELQRYRGGRGLGGTLGLVVYILCVLAGTVAVAIVGVLVWSEIKALYEEDQRESPHTPLWGLWLLLPIVGNFVWFIPTQRALNEFWQSKGAAAPS
jgi:hypothetical protein